MEEYDELARGPDDDGSIDLSHNTWKTLPSELNDFSSSLLHLRMSNNQLSTVPEAIGNLVLLQSLDFSFNHIENIDGAIGKCIRLRRLNVSKNRLQELPKETCNCLLLEEINASDNLLTTLPQELANLLVITKIDARNNKLTTIPTELSRMPTLAHLLCDGNPQLTSAPENMRGDTKLLLFCLEMQQKFADAIRPLEARHDELRAENGRLRDELSRARGGAEGLEREVADLEWERPDRYIRWKGKFLALVGYVLGRSMRLLRRAWREFQRWRERRRTHPLY